MVTLVRVIARVDCADCEGAGTIPTIENPFGSECRFCHGGGTVEIEVSCRTCQYWYGGACLRALMLNTLMTSANNARINTDPTFACNMWSRT